MDDVLSVTCFFKVKEGSSETVGYGGTYTETLLRLHLPLNDKV